MSWLKITCGERDAIYHAERPEKLRPISSCTDINTRSASGHPCGRALGHDDEFGHVCRCEAERFCAGRGAYVGSRADWPTVRGENACATG